MENVIRIDRAKFKFKDGRSIPKLYYKAIMAMEIILHFNPNHKSAKIFRYHFEKFSNQDKIVMSKI